MSCYTVWTGKFHVPAFPEVIRWIEGDMHISFEPEVFLFTGFLATDSCIIYLPGLWVYKGA